MSTRKATIVKKKAVSAVKSAKKVAKKSAVKRAVYIPKIDNSALRAAGVVQISDTEFGVLQAISPSVVNNSVYRVVFPTAAEALAFAKRGVYGIARHDTKHAPIKAPLRRWEDEDQLSLKPKVLEIEEVILDDIETRKKEFQKMVEAETTKVSEMGSAPIGHGKPELPEIPDFEEVVFLERYVSGEFNGRSRKFFKTEKEKKYFDTYSKKSDEENVKTLEEFHNKIFTYASK